MSQDATSPDAGAAAVRHAPDRNRYEIDVDGSTVGFVRYTMLGDRRVFFHTEIDDRFGGRGLAGELVAHALGDTRAAGLRIVAVCPYVARWIDKHPEFDDVRAPVNPEVLAAVDAARD